MADTVPMALVTGASSGIGRAVAAEFARRGYRLFLTGRNEAELQRLSVDLNERFGTGSIVFCADLADSGDRRELVRLTAEHAPNVLVNNAGFGVKGDFADSALEDEMSIVRVQIDAMLELTKAVLPEMKQRQDGLILNVASVYSFSPVPQQAVYAAAKSFVFSFSSSLRSELRADGIKVSVLAPGITQTEFRARAGIPDKKGRGMKAEDVARIGVEKALRGKALIVPGWENKLFVFIVRHLPAGVSASLIDLINSGRGLRTPKSSDTGL